MRLTGTILLSRQPLRPCGGDDWVKNSVRAVKWLKERNVALYTSVGLHTWELLTSLGSLHKLPLRIFVPCANMTSFESARAETLSQFQLVQADAQILPVFPQSGQSDRESLWHRRDKMIIEHAQAILPVSVRSGGYLESLIESARREGKPVMDDFLVPYQRRRQRMAYRIFPETVNPRLKKLAGDFLIHWTRTANTAWPTEQLIDFYKDIVSCANYPRTAYHTLLNIFNTGTIVASARHMPENVRTVSFSSRAPTGMIPLFRWRARYREMSFEPYGVGIERNTAVQLGVRAVRYRTDESGTRQPETDRWLNQSRGTKSDWRVEEEFRHRGDLDISSISHEKMVLFCRTPAEAEKIEDLTGVMTIPFTIGSTVGLFEQ